MIDKGIQPYRVLDRHSRDSCRWGLSGLVVGVRWRRILGLDVVWGLDSGGQYFGLWVWLCLSVLVSVCTMVLSPTQTQEQELRSDAAGVLPLEPEPSTSASTAQFTSSACTTSAGNLSRILYSIYLFSHSAALIDSTVHRWNLGLAGSGLGTSVSMRPRGRSLPVPPLYSRSSLTGF